MYVNKIKEVKHFQLSLKKGVDLLQQKNIWYTTKLKRASD
jgi:hypothetical protein